MSVSLPPSRERRPVLTSLRLPFLSTWMTSIRARMMECPAQSTIRPRTTWRRPRREVIERLWFAVKYIVSLPQVLPRTPLASRSVALRAVGRAGAADAAVTAARAVGARPVGVWPVGSQTVAGEGLVRHTGDDLQDRCAGGGEELRVERVDRLVEAAAGLLVELAVDGVGQRRPAPARAAARPPRSGPPGRRRSPRLPRCSRRGRGEPGRRWCRWPAPWRRGCRATSSPDPRGIWTAMSRRGRWRRRPGMHDLVRRALATVAAERRPRR